MPVDAPDRRIRWRIATAVQGGRTVAQAAAMFGVSTEAPRQACRQLGVSLSRPGKPGLSRRARQRERRRQMVGAVRQGTPIELVAERFGVDERTVRSACREHEVVPGAVQNLRRRSSLQRRRAARGAAGRLARPAPASGEAGKSCAAEVLRLLLRTDLTYDQIDRRVGVSRQRVRQIFQRVVGAGGRPVGAVRRAPRHALDGPTSRSGCRSRQEYAPRDGDVVSPLNGARTILYTVCRSTMDRRRQSPFTKSASRWAKE